MTFQNLFGINIIQFNFGLIIATNYQVKNEIQAQDLFIFGLILVNIAPCSAFLHYFFSVSTKINYLSSSSMSLMDNHNPITILCWGVSSHHQMAHVVLPVFKCFLPSFFMFLVLMFTGHICRSIKSFPFRFLLQTHWKTFKEWKNCLAFFLCWYCWLSIQLIMFHYFLFTPSSGCIHT